MTGTNSTKVTKGRSQAKTLEPDQICAIIKSCAEHGVSSFRYDALEICFGKQTKTSSSLDESPSTESPVEALTDEQHARQAKEALLDDEIRTRQAQIEELMVTDPEKAEKLIAQGELDDVDDEPGDLE